MSLHHVTEVAWTNLLAAWSYPFPFGMLLLSSLLLVLAAISMSVRALRDSRHRNSQTELASDLDQAA
jgi:hypothetical protein